MGPYPNRVHAASALAPGSHAITPGTRAPTTPGHTSGPTGYRTLPFFHPKSPHETPDPLNLPKYEGTLPMRSSATVPLSRCSGPTLLSWRQCDSFIFHMCTARYSQASTTGSMMMIAVRGRSGTGRAGPATGLDQPSSAGATAALPGCGRDMDVMDPARCDCAQPIGEQHNVVKVRQLCSSILTPCRYSQAGCAQSHRGGVHHFHVPPAAGQRCGGASAARLVEPSSWACSAGARSSPHRNHHHAARLSTPVSSVQCTCEI